MNPAPLNRYESVLDWIEDPVLCGAHPESGSDGSGLDSSLAQHMCVASMRIELVEKLKVAKQHHSRPIF